MERENPFSALLEDPCNELVRKAMDEGHTPIGYSCSYVPDVMLSVEGLFPVRVRAPGIAGTELADNYLSSVICSYTRSLLEFALDGRYDFLGGWVFAASCDHLRRLYDNLEYLRWPGFSRILDVPHKTGDAAVAWYAEELRLFAKALTDHFGCDLGRGSLAKAIRKHNTFNALLREIGEHRRGDHPVITGTEYHRLVIAASAAPKKALISILEKIRDDLPKRTPLPPCRARLLLVGGHLDDPGYIGIIESQGGMVVGDRLCTGSYPGLMPIPEMGDPITVLAKHYLTRTSCPRMMESFQERAENIVSLARECRADGIVIQIMKFCDTWGVEAASFFSYIREAGIPVLRLERDYRLGGEGQLRTRIQAFIESMDK
ncbi:MAG: 2-hydroxyacyl-CoA dehydratase family protein [Thermovirgaceae bacterium]|nr:2-hydroxyacyl-CoA dehydratase family protein [Thermovirgaceae bacterium]